MDKSTRLCNSMRAFESSYGASLGVGRAEWLHLTSDGGADRQFAEIETVSRHFENKSAFSSLLYIVIQCTVHN
jgi:hypothetical protein